MPSTQTSCAVGLDREHGVTIVTVHGDVDLFAAPALSDALSRALHQPSPVVVDLSDCSLFESSGMNALLGAHFDAERDGRHILVARLPHSSADRALSLTLPGFFAEHDSLDDAVAAAVL